MKFLKDLKSFILNTAHDERIPSKDKKIILALIGLIVSPVDLIPDWIPFFGLIDDVIYLSFILDYFFSVLDSRVLLSHFPWNMKAYARIKSIAHMTQFLVPGFIKKRLWSYVGDPY